jgi:hypothetical protein
LSAENIEEDTIMSRARYFDRRPNDPTPEQIRMMCELIRSRWAATGDKRLIPELRPTERNPMEPARFQKRLE